MKNIHEVFCEIYREVIEPARKAMLDDKPITEYWQGWFDSLCYYEMKKRLPELENFNEEWTKLMKAMDKVKKRKLKKIKESQINQGIYETIKDVLK